MTNKNVQNDQNTIQRNWHDLKPGDVIFFATGWYEVIDAYPVAKNTVLIKIAIRGPKAPTMIETHRVHVNAGSQATCRA